MGKINLLSSKIYNRIAAGEVVERPASVVKELIENSIDAGSKNITIEIQNGGISSIKIIDDGSGIERDDLRNAIMPHATSKISKIDDLYNIQTLGFRGEALSSIASVSKLSIASKPKEQEIGASIYTEGGDNAEICDDSIAKGTCIIVKNLFYNTPAREKFLRSAKTEENEISATIARFILGNSNIAFNYFADSKNILQSFGDGFESAFACVYGASVIKDCYYINAQKNGININGYVGKPHYSKPNKSYQIVFLNGRFVQNQTISSSIANAYAPYLMKRQYPFYVLNITMPSDSIDCNVHPNKIDVRFINNQIIYGALYSVLNKVLDGNRDALNIVVECNNQQSKSIKTLSEYVTHNNGDGAFRETFKFDTLVFNDSGIKKEEVVDDIFVQNKAYLQSLEQTPTNKYQQQSIKIEKDLKLVGQALNTFLILEDGTDLYLIDQHAAHERILFDKFMGQIDKRSVEVQPMLLPYVFSVTPEEAEFISSKSNTFEEIGLSINEFGVNTYKISSIPIFLQNVDFRIFISDLLSDLNALKSLTLTGLLKEKIAQKACKSAVKAGDKLSNENIEFLLGLLKGNLGLKCPHGRPVAVKISRMEIDKWFKRIV